MWYAHGVLSHFLVHATALQASGLQCFWSSRLIECLLLLAKRTPNSLHDLVVKHRVSCSMLDTM